MKYIFLLLLLFCLIHNVEAQATNKKVSFQSVAAISLLNGDKTTSLALQAIFGAGYQNTFLGLGVGLDYYRFRSIPLFADVRHYFGKAKEGMFIYGDLGYNYDWLTEKQIPQANIYSTQNRFSGGIYYDAGVGYKFGVKNSDAFLLSAGYSFKRLKSEIGSGICPLIGPCYDAIQTYRYYFPRLVVKAGWRF